MKKTLRGKRHIRARRSVEAGRRKREIVKGARTANRIRRALRMFPSYLTSAMLDVIQALQGLGKVFSDTASNFRKELIDG